MVIEVSGIIITAVGIAGIIEPVQTGITGVIIIGTTGRTRKTIRVGNI